MEKSNPVNCFMVRVPIEIYAMFSSKFVVSFVTSVITDKLTSAKGILNITSRNISINFLSRTRVWWISYGLDRSVFTWGSSSQ